MARVVVVMQVPLGQFVALPRRDLRGQLPEVLKATHL